MNFCNICVFLKTSIFLSISHMVSTFSIKITFSLTNWGLHKINVFFYVIYITIRSPRTVSHLKHLQISDGEVTEKPSHTFSFLLQLHMPLLIINVRAKNLHGSLLTSRSQVAIPQNLLHTFNYLKPKLLLVYQFFVLLTPPNYNLVFLNTYWQN